MDREVAEAIAEMEARMVGIEERLGRVERKMEAVIGDVGAMARAMRPQGQQPGAQGPRPVR